MDPNPTKMWTPYFYHIYCVDTMFADTIPATPCLLLEKSNKHMATERMARPASSLPP